MRDTQAESELAVLLGDAAIAEFELRANRKADLQERRRLKERVAVAVWQGWSFPIPYALAA